MIKGIKKELILFFLISNVLLTGRGIQFGLEPVYQIDSTIEYRFYFKQNNVYRVGDRLVTPETTARIQIEEINDLVMGKIKFEQPASSGSRISQYNWYSPLFNVNDEYFPYFVKTSDFNYWEQKTTEIPNSLVNETHFYFENITNLTNEEIILRESINIMNGVIEYLYSFHQINQSVPSVFEREFMENPKGFEALKEFILDHPLEFGLLSSGIIFLATILIGRKIEGRKRKNKQNNK